MDVQIIMGKRNIGNNLKNYLPYFRQMRVQSPFFANNDTLSSVRPESVTQERHITAFINSPSSVAKGYTNSLSISPTSKMTSVVVISLRKLKYLGVVRIS